MNRLIKFFTLFFSVALCTIPLFWGIYWQTYDWSKDFLSSSFPNLPNFALHMGSAVGAGALGNFVVNPFWVIKTRIQTQVFEHTEEKFFKILKDIYLKEGFLAYYKGLNASLLGLSHVAIQFPIYEGLKERARAYRGKEESLIDLLLSSITAKVVASSITYPHEVLRARLQYSHESAALSSSSGSILRMLVKIVREEGLLGLYSGYRTNLVRIVPATVSTFVSYEYISKYLLTERQSNGNL